MPADPASSPLSGIDRLLADEAACARLAGMRVGLLSNHACQTAGHEPAARALRDRLAAAGARGGRGLIRLFAAEHALTLQAPAGAAVADAPDPLTGLPCTSLYRPGTGNDAALAGIDALVIDLRDVGVRCYTYAASAARLAVAAMAEGVEVTLCDRPNPLGPAVAGPRPDRLPAPRGRSLLCFFDVPFVHGTTPAALIVGHLDAARAEAVGIYPADPAGAPPLGWTGPSPALAHPAAVALYPALVLLEGTNVSEGRRSSHAFRSVSAPGLDAAALAAAANGWDIGFRAAPGRMTAMCDRAPVETHPAVVFDPAGRAPRDAFALGVRLLGWLHRHHEGFAWERTAEGGFTIDALLGTDRLRMALDAGDGADDLLACWGASAAAGVQTS